MVAQAFSLCFFHPAGFSRTGGTRDLPVITGHRKHIIRSNAYSRLTDEAATFLTATASSEVIVLAASRGAADDLARQCCDPASSGIHRSTVTGLAASFATLSIASAKLAPMSHLSREA